MGRAEDENLIAEVNLAYQTGRSEMKEEIIEAIDAWLLKNFDRPATWRSMQTAKDIILTLE